MFGTRISCNFESRAAELTWQSWIREHRLSGATRIRFQCANNNYYRVYEITPQVILLNQVNHNDGLIYLSSDEDSDSEDSDSDSDNDGDIPVPDAPPNTPEATVEEPHAETPNHIPPFGQLVKDMDISSHQPAPLVPPGFEHITPSPAPAPSKPLSPNQTATANSPSPNNAGQSGTSQLVKDVRWSGLL